MAALLIAASDFLDPSGAPDETGGFRVDPTFFIVLVLVGFAIGAIGHLYKSRTLVAVGIVLIMLSTVLIPIALQATN